MPIDRQTMIVSWLVRALTLGLLAVTLPLAVRGLYGPPGAWVHVRWQPTVDAAERQRLETAWQLVDGQEVSPATWRYDLTAPSEGAPPRDRHTYGSCRHPLHRRTAVHPRARRDPDCPAPRPDYRRRRYHGPPCRSSVAAPGHACRAVRGCQVLPQTDAARGCPEHRSGSPRRLTRGGRRPSRWCWRRGCA